MSENPGGESVYERAQKYLIKEGAEPKIKEDSALTDKVKATRYLKALRDGESIERNTDTVIAQKELLQSMESGNSIPANYLDGAKPTANGVDFGSNLSYDDFTNDDTNKQKGFYKLDKNLKQVEAVTLFTPEAFTVEQSTKDNDAKSPNYEFGMKKTPNGTITEGKFSTETGALINGSKVFKDGTQEKGTYDAHGEKFTGVQRMPDGTIEQFKNGKTIDVQKVADTAAQASTLKVQEKGPQVSAVTDTQKPVAPEVIEGIKNNLKEKVGKTIITLAGNPPVGIDPSKVEIDGPDAKGLYQVKARELSALTKDPILVDANGNLKTTGITISKSIWDSLGAKAGDIFGIQGAKEANKLLSEIHDGDKYTLVQKGNQLGIQKV